MGKKASEAESAETPTPSPLPHEVIADSLFEIEKFVALGSDFLKAEAAKFVQKMESELASKVAHSAQIETKNDIVKSIK